MPAIVLEMLLPSEADKLTKGGRDAAFFIVSTDRFTKHRSQKGRGKRAQALGRNSDVGTEVPRTV